MRTDLRDVTFIIAIRLDSIQRLENIIAITDCLCKYFNTNIMVLEADRYNNGILKALLNKKVNYFFVEDKDPVFHRTKYFNQMTGGINTPYIALWDSDIVIDKSSIINAILRLRDNDYDVAFPYNGICFDIPDIIRSLYLKKKDIRMLYRHRNKMDRLYPYLLTGGAIILDRDKYIQAGMENENHYGWGNDDFDRYYRFVGLNYRIYRVNKPLFHLGHPRSNNSQFRSKISEQISFAEKNRVESSSRFEIQASLEVKKP